MFALVLEQKTSGNATFIRRIIDYARIVERLLVELMVQMGLRLGRAHQNPVKDRSPRVLRKTC